MNQYLSRVLPDIGQVYLDRVMAEYELLPSPQAADKTPPEQISAIVAKFPKERDQLTWGDLLILEKYVVSKEPLEVLRQRLSTLRENYRDVVGEKNYDTYLLSQPSQKNGSMPAEDTLRADIGRLLDSLHWAYFMTRKREQLRTAIIRNVGLTILLLFVPFGVSFFLLYHHGYKGTATIAAVLFMGALGGFVSLQQRIQDIPTEGDPVLTLFELQSGQFSLYLAPLTGAIFALLVFLMFLGGLLTGSLFPDFKDLQMNPVKYGNLFEYVQYGKLMVWSFIVGFAERFVPDTLTGLVGRSRQSSGRPTPASAIRGKLTENLVPTEENDSTKSFAKGKLLHIPRQPDTAANASTRPARKNR